MTDFLFPIHRYVRKTITAALAIMFCMALVEYGETRTEYLLAFFLSFTVAKGNLINPLWFLTLPIGWGFTTLLLFTLGHYLIGDWGYIFTTWGSLTSFSIFVLAPVALIANYLNDS